MAPGLASQCNLWRRAKPLQRLRIAVVSAAREMEPASDRRRSRRCGVYPKLVVANVQQLKANLQRIGVVHFAAIAQGSVLNRQ